MWGWMGRTLIAGSAILILTGSGCEECWDCQDCRWSDDGPPHAPTGLYSVTGDRRVDLYWLPVDVADLAGYRVYVSRHPNGPFEEIADTRRTRFTDEGLTNGRTWFYAVTAFDYCGNESALSRGDVFDTPRPEGFNVVLESSTRGSGARAAWDFSRMNRQRVYDSGTDIWFTGDDVGCIHVSPGGGIQDWGYGSIDDLGWAPSGGWSPSGRVEAIPGHTYAVRTADGYYAKFYLREVRRDRAVLDWAVQLDRGNRELSADPPVTGSAPGTAGESMEAGAGSGTENLSDGGQGSEGRGS
jgi:hypothetical protein